MKKRWVKTGFVATLMLLSSTTMAAKFTKTGLYEGKDRGKDCDFHLFALKPRQEFHEIGIIDFSNAIYKASGPGTAEKLKKKSAKFVCENGGNGLLIWGVNGFGNYKQAIVIHVEHEQN